MANKSSKRPTVVKKNKTKIYAIGPSGSYEISLKGHEINRIFCGRETFYVGSLPHVYLFARGLGFTVKNKTFLMIDHELKKRDINIMSDGWTDTYFFVDSEQCLYGFGNNWEFQDQTIYTHEYQVGVFGINTFYDKKKKKHMNQRILNPIQLQFNYSHKIIKIETGYSFVIFLCDDGHIYGLGRNCGFAKQTKYISETPMVIEGVNNIADISCGVDFALCLNNNGECIGFGDNEKGQLADIQNHLIFEVDYSKFSEMENIQRAQLQRKFNNKPTKIRYFSDNNISIKQIKCGNQHSCVVDSNNNVYVFGMYYVPIGKSVKTNIPVSVELPIDTSIYHTIVSGYCTGFNIPVSVQHICCGYYICSDFKEIVKKIECGGYWTAVLCTNGHLYACGEFPAFRDMTSNRVRRMDTLPHLKFAGKIIDIVGSYSNVFCTIAIQNIKN